MFLNHCLSSLSKTVFRTKKISYQSTPSITLTPREWPGKASVVSQGPWQSSPAPSSSENQLPSEGDSLQPWSWSETLGMKTKGKQCVMLIFFQLNTM